MRPHQAQGEARRALIMTFIRDFVGAHGYAPSMKQISDGVGLSSANATRGHLLILAEEGFITMAPGVGRSIGLIDPAPDGWRRSA